MPRNAGRLIEIFIITLALVVALPTEALAKSEKTTRKKSARVKSHRTTRAPAAAFDKSDRYADLVIEARTGRILRANNPDAIRHPASLTKMMTLYLTFQALEQGVIKLETLLTVSSVAASQPPSKLGLRAGQSLRVYDAVMALITESANDAAVVLAENLGGSVDKFADLMNRQAHALGMNGTHFENPSGLPNAKQVTTARDMASLGYALIYHYPGYYPYFGRETYRYNGKICSNHNHLMSRYPGMDGIKTGYIGASGFNLVASATQNGTRLIGVVFGGKSARTRDNQMASLLDRSFAVRDGSIEEASLARSPQGEGDAGEFSRKYMSLPTKVAAAFPPRGGARALTQAPRFAQETGDESGRNAQPGESGWGIQVGAYSDVASAQQVLAQLSQSAGQFLSQAEPSLQKITMSDGTVVYRARFTGINQQTARSVCTYMIKRGQSCMVVSNL